MCHDQHKLPGERLSVLFESLPKSRPLGDPIYARQINEKQTGRRILVFSNIGNLNFFQDINLRHNVKCCLFFKNPNWYS